MRVMKFGAIPGSDPARLRDIPDVIKSEPNGPFVVVCTALDGMTDMLIGAARSAVVGDEAAIEAARRDLWGRHRVLAERLVSDEWEREALYREWAELLKIFDRITRAIATLREPSPRGTDAVAALGELFIVHLYAVVLRQGGVPARVADATELIITDDTYGGARPILDESMARVRARLSALLQAGIVPVITGYIGATRGGVVTTLGRGGGDYTAALVGSAIGAEEVCLWTDVDGVLTADPKIVKGARTLPELSFDEAAEIASFGAEVLHPRALIPLAGLGTALHIRNIFRPDQTGTRITERPQPNARPARTIISARGLRLVRLTGASENWRPDFFARALARLAESGIEVLASAHSFIERHLLFVVRASDAAFIGPSVEHALEREGGSVRDLNADLEVALVAVIGASDGLTPRTLASLGRSHANIVALTRNSASAISFIVPEAEVDGVVRALHSDLELA